MHRRMIDPVLKTLDGDRAGYFSDLINKVEADPRTANHPNFVYLLLKETMRQLPTHLNKDELIHHLFVFIEAHILDLERIVFDQDYIYDQSVVQDVTNEFILEIVDLTLQHYEMGDIDTGEPDVTKYTWPYRAEDLIDPDDEDALDRLKERPAYTGPERRKKR